MHAAVPIADHSLAPLAKGTDVSAQGDIAIIPGGTTWLFANALTSSTGMLPLVAASIGTDWAGDMLSRSLSERGFPVQGVVRVPTECTDLITTVNFNGHARLMVWPRSKVGRKVRAWEWPRIERLISLYDVRFAWISGYLLDDPDPFLFADVRALLANLRRLRIPVVLDLVPHDFLNRIGPLGQLEREIGPVDVLVGELGTLADLGFGQRPPAGEDPRPHMIGCAQGAAAGRVGAVVQHRVDRDVYAQAVVGPTPGQRVTGKPVPASGPRGIGDDLAVEALRMLGLVA
jgi:sugar/nucleoside kinase (ribokinase family)